MIERRVHVSSMHELPRAGSSRKNQFQLNAIWIIPVLAGVIAAWLVFKDVQRAGPTITIHFADGKGIQAGHAVVRYRGVQVGEVRSVELAKDMRTVDVTVRLERSAANLAHSSTNG